MEQQIDWTERLEAVSSSALGGVVLDDAFRISAVTDSMLARMGMSESAALSKSGLDLFHPADIGRAASIIDRAQPGKELAPQGVFRVLSKSGTWDIYEMSIKGLGEECDNAVLLEFDTAGVEARLRALVDDSVELTQLLVDPGKSLRASFRAITDFAERNVDGLSLSITTFAEDGTSATFCQRDLDDSIVAMNEAAHPLSLPPHVVEAHSKAKMREWQVDSEVGAILPDRPDRMTMVLLDPDANLLGYVDAYRALTSTPEEDEWRVYRLVSQTLRAVMLHTQLDVRIDYLTKHDPLTGLLTRYEILKRMQHTDLAGTGVLVINLDGFAWVNESLGFDAGDTVLSSVGASILAHIPSSAVAARLSADEFLIWLPKAADAEDVFRTSEDLRKVIMVPIDNADRRGRTRCSIGSTQALHAENADEVIRRATTAMLEAKRAGGDRVAHA